MLSKTLKKKQKNKSYHALYTLENERVLKGRRGNSERKTSMIACTPTRREFARLKPRSTLMCIGSVNVNTLTFCSFECLNHGR
jgi:hypothetical protein